MKFIITGRKIDVTDGLRDRVHKKLGKLEKFFHEDTEVHVTLEE
ncbi:MAG: putative sigma-54 modulation protein [Clostridiales bacterium]|nr:putative sigma-54 modulation protein [Clostridiales bacterium]